MRFLIVGLGSMGKRRVRNFQYLGYKDILGFDIRPDRNEEAKSKYGITVFNSFESAIKGNPNALIISTPPDEHTDYILKAIDLDLPFFVEASVLDERYEDIIKKLEKKTMVGVPSCTMRFHHSIKLIKDLLDSGAIGRIYSFTHECRTYLPDWHKYEDYRDYYVSKKEVGGCRESVPFELEWIQWLLGKVKKISCMKNKISNLDTDIDDVYYLMVECESGIFGSLCIDVLSQVPFRELRIIGEKGNISWDFPTKKVRLYKADEGKWIDFDEPEAIKEKSYVFEDNAYIEEMKYFLSLLKGEKEPIYDLVADWKVLKLLYLAEKSCDEGRTLDV
jgi:predicted dehydrogenase